jgi:transcriptional accessory protein Tex/SPT6
MTDAHSSRIAKELWQIKAVSSLITEGSTIPFIARYLEK